MAKDLVCNMDIDEKTAKYKTIHNGKTYYFCAPGCKKDFEEEPELYINAEASVNKCHQHEDEGIENCGCGHNH